MFSLDVPYQGVFQMESFFANITLIRHHTSVQILVLSQSGLLEETLATYTAQVRALGRVSIVVLFQAAMGVESVLTDLTGERPLTTVSAHVGDQVNMADEFLGALFAGKGLFSSVTTVVVS
jgi:hypothetical protein